MSNPQPCPGCNIDTLSPWDMLMVSRRCTLCGYQEERPADVSVPDTPPC